MEIIGYFWGKRLKILSNKAGLKTKPHQSCRIYPTITSFQKTAWSPTLFIQTLHYVYTDISAISVTFRNSAYNISENVLCVNKTSMIFRRKSHFLLLSFLFTSHKELFSSFPYHFLLSNIRSCVMLLNIAMSHDCEHPQYQNSFSSFYMIHTCGKGGQSDLMSERSQVSRIAL